MTSIAGNNSIRGDETITFTDNMSFDGTERGGKMTTDAQVWLGSTIAPHVRNSAFSSSDGSLNLVFSTPTATTGKLDVTVNKNVVKDLHVSRFIVSAGGLADGANYTTIQSAINAAAIRGGHQTVFIQPGTYTENLTFVTGVDIVGFNSNAVSSLGAPNTLIKGTHTASAAIINIQNLGFQNDSLTILTCTNVCRIFFTNCFFNVSGANAITANTCQVYLFGCTTASSGAGLFTFTSSSAYVSGCEVLSGGNNTFNASGCLIVGSYFAGNIATSGTNGTFSAIGSVLVKDSGSGYTFNGTGDAIVPSNSNYIRDCHISGDSDLQISIGTGVIFSITDTSIYGTNAATIIGAGTLRYSNLSFDGTGNLITTTIQQPLIGPFNALKVTTPGAYPYTTTPQDGVILVDTSVARTINLNATPITGQQYVIKDLVGSAAANNITITPAAGLIDGAASKTISSNYASIIILYNGTGWSII